MRAAVQAEPPGGGVAAVRGEIAPVLRDQPDPDYHDERSGEAVVHQPDECADRERGQHEHAEVPVMPAAPEEKDARTELVLLDPKAPTAPPFRQRSSSGSARRSSRHTPFDAGETEKFNPNFSEHRASDGPCHPDSKPRRSSLLHWPR
jgi:hypothetical protein